MWRASNLKPQSVPRQPTIDLPIIPQAIGSSLEWSFGPQGPSDDSNVFFAVQKITQPLHNRPQKN